MNGKKNMGFLSSWPLMDNDSVQCSWYECQFIVAHVAWPRWSPMVVTSRFDTSRGDSSSSQSGYLSVSCAKFEYSLVRGDGQDHGASTVHWCQESHPSVRPSGSQLEYDHSSPRNPNPSALSYLFFLLILSHFRRCDPSTEYAFLLVCCFGPLNCCLCRWNPQETSHSGSAVWRCVRRGPVAQRCYLYNDYATHTVLHEALPILRSCRIHYNNARCAGQHVAATRRRGLAAGCWSKTPHCRMCKFPERAPYVSAQPWSHGGSNLPTLTWR